MQQHSIMDLINPHPRQWEFLQATAEYDFTLFGGASAGGKSYILRWALIYWLIRWFKDYDKRGIMVGLFCETFRDLEDRQLSKITYEFPDWLGKQRGYDFVLNDDLGGGILAFRNLDDASKYLSVEFAAIAIDELSKNPEKVFDYLAFNRMRWPGIARTKFMAATNPGGIGGAWVKRYWIDREFPDRISHLAPQFKYIKSLPTDNPHNAPAYIDKLRALPEMMRRALLEGDWNAFEGQAFSEWNPDIHVVEPFEIPAYWRRWGSNDPGYNDPGVWHWYACDEDGRVFVYREATFADRSTTYSEQAKLVKERMTTHRVGNNGKLIAEVEPIQWWVTGMDAYHRDRAHGTGKSIADYYESQGLHGFRQPIHGAGSRKTRAGIMHEYLKPYLNHEGRKVAKLAIFNTCKKTISTLPALPADEKKPEEVASCDIDHHYDSLSYGLTAWHTSHSTQESTSTFQPGSLGDLLGHKEIMFPKPKHDSAFTFGKK